MLKPLSQIIVSVAACDPEEEEAFWEHVRETEENDHSQFRIRDLQVNEFYPIKEWDDSEDEARIVAELEGPHEGGDVIMEYRDGAQFRVTRLHFYSLINIFNKEL